MSAAVVPRVRALECPNCGGTIELRGFGQAVNAVCVQCLSVLDARSPGLEILQKAAAQERIQPLIPLGTRGAFGGAKWEAIGFQVREILVEGIPYRWSEYLLYNPWRGYRYLTEYDGHWNLIRTLAALPETSGKTVTFEGRAYKHFQRARARTAFVMGEFPWQVRVGEEVAVNDYVSPPHVLSSEETPDEVVWSAGEYVSGQEIWRAFSLRGRAPGARGIYANQPSPYTGRIRSLWVTFAWLLLLFVITAAVIGLAGRGRDVFAARYAFNAPNRGEPAFVTPVFSLPDGNVEVHVDTNLENDWVFFSMALINDETGDALDFGREVSYYHGRDSDGDWTEGSRSEGRVLPAVAAGRYYLRVEPEMDDDGRPHSVNYTITVRSGVMHGYWLIPVLILLPLPAVWRTWRSAQFEGRRWAESDDGSILSAGSGGGND